MHHAQIGHQLELVQESARHLMRFKIAEFDASYDANA
jgi:hypothetical protein